jgi:hypothetical protein
MVEHGITVGISRLGNDFLMKMKVVGKLKHSDYDIIVPMLESAITGISEPKIKVLVDITEFDGYELRAVWDDLKFGLKYNSEFTKIAVVGNKRWEEYGVRISNWFMSGDLKYFENMSEAFLWLSEDKNEKKEVEKVKDVINKELDSRKNEIKGELESLFKLNMKITDWDVPEADDQKAAELLVDILQEKLSEIKDDVKNGKYKNY